VRYWLLSLVLPVAAFACADTLDGDGSDGSGAGATNVGGGSAQCAKKACGEPCDTCQSEDCQPQACDGEGECDWLSNLTCTECPKGDESKSNGSDCPAVGLVCEYGGLDELADCRSRYECTVNGWDYNSDLSEASDCNYWQGGTCPMDIPADFDPCDPVEYYDMCDYPEVNTYCACSKCAAGDCQGMTAVWLCAPPPPEPCPTAPGLIGHFCNDEGLVCFYGACALEAEGNPTGADLITTERTCSGGFWTETPTDC
jgi:hypothetical protein